MLKTYFYGKNFFLELNVCFTFVLCLYNPSLTCDLQICQTVTFFNLYPYLLTQ